MSFRVNTYTVVVTPVPADTAWLTRAFTAITPLSMSRDCPNRNSDNETSSTATSNPLSQSVGHPSWVQFELHD